MGTLRGSRVVESDRGWGKVTGEGGQGTRGLTVFVIHCVALQMFDNGGEVIELARHEHEAAIRDMPDVHLEEPPVVVHTHHVPVLGTTPPAADRERETHRERERERDIETRERERARAHGRYG